jgi:glycosyltransferase involved in cell wall biosynthesis
MHRTKRKSMRISLGILAYQEEARIGGLLSQLALQTLLRRDDVELHIHVVANGCTDRTADVSRRALSGEAFQLPSVKARVHELATPGKANAWNHLVHECVDPASEYLFLLDADIKLLDSTTFSDVLESLLRNPSALVAVDEPVKDVELKPFKTLIDRCVLGLSRGTHDIRNAICGQLYCLRFSVAVSIWLPTGLIGDDGFLRAIILTDGFTRPEDLNKITFTEGARHAFETRRNIRDILHHQTRLAIGTGLNVLLFAHLREKLKSLPRIETYIRDMNHENPDWLTSVVTSKAAENRYFIMYGSFLSRRSTYLKTLKFGERLRKVPFFVFGSLVDALTFLKANMLMRKGAARGYW